MATKSDSGKLQCAYRSHRLPHLKLPVGRFLVTSLKQLLTFTTNLVTFLWNRGVYGQLLFGGWKCMEGKIVALWLSVSWVVGKNVWKSQFWQGNSILMHHSREGLSNLHHSYRQFDQQKCLIESFLIQDPSSLKAIKVELEKKGISLAQKWHGAQYFTWLCILWYEFAHQVHICIIVS